MGIIDLTKEADEASIISFDSELSTPSNRTMSSSFLDLVLNDSGRARKNSELCYQTGAER